MILKKAFFFLILGGCFYFLGMSRQAFGATCDSEKSFGREDQIPFARYCGYCHSMSGIWKKPGPPLGGLFERKQLVTGKPVTDETVREIITKGGRGFMPGFQYTLTPDQVNEILRYLRETHCSGVPAAKKGEN